MPQLAGLLACSHIMLVTMGAADCINALQAAATATPSGLNRLD
jgi:hypothetical protein